MNMITDPERIRLFRLQVILKGMKLELGGLRKRGPSAFSIARSEFKLSRNRVLAYAEMKQIVAEFESKVLD